MSDTDTYVLGPAYVLPYLEACTPPGIAAAVRHTYEERDEYRRLLEQGRPHVELLMSYGNQSDDPEIRAAVRALLEM